MVNGGVMRRIAIVTDSDASLPPAAAEKYGIIVVPITVHFGDDVYETGIDIDDVQVFERVDRDKRLPTTAAPSPGKFVDAYQSAFDAGFDAVICFTVSSEVSAVYQSAISAREEMSDKPISVVDSKTLSLPQGFMVIEAAKAASEGNGVDVAISRAEDLRDRSSLYGALATLKYLAMSGRVGQLAAGMASMLNIKPVLTVENGKLEMIERVRTRKKSWNYMLDRLESDLDGTAVEQMAVIHAAAEEQAGRFKAMLLERFEVPEEIMIAEITPGLSVHTGAGMIGVVTVKAHS